MGNCKLYKNIKRGAPNYTWCIERSPNSGKKGQGKQKYSLPQSAYFYMLLQTHFTYFLLLYKDLII